MLKRLHHWPDHMDPDIFLQRAGIAHRPRQTRKTFARHPVRREVVIKRLRQQGLTQWEAEQQFEWGYW